RSAESESILICFVPRVSSSILHVCVGRDVNLPAPESIRNDPIPRGRINHVTLRATAETDERRSIATRLGFGQQVTPPFDQQGEAGVFFEHRGQDGARIKMTSLSAFGVNP